MFVCHRMAREDERKVHLAFGFAGRTVSVVDGRQVSEMKRAAISESRKAGGKGLNRVIQSKDNKSVPSQHGGNVLVAPNVAVEPVYVTVRGKKGEADIALSKNDGSLDQFLESLRFQQIECNYFQGNDFQNDFDQHGKDEGEKDESASDDESIDDA